MKRQYKPDVRVKLSPRVTLKTKRLIDQICRRHQMFESDVLRFCLEAIVPVAAKRGLTRVVGGTDHLPAMFTVRTSLRIKKAIDRITANGPYSEAEVLRFCYDAILPVAYKEGFAKIMAMRAQGL